jgi:small-conductance mechanosensitive channel
MAGSPPLRHEATRRRRLERRAGILLLLCGALVAVAPRLSAQAPEASGTEPDNDIGRIEARINTAPVEIDGNTLFRVRGATSLPAATRAGNISRRIEAIAADPTIPLTSLRVSEADGLSWIMAGDRPVMTVTEADARVEQLSRQELAIAHLTRLRLTISEYREARKPAAVREHMRDTLIAAVLAALAIAGVLLLNFWSGRLITRVLERRAGAVQPSVSIVKAERIHDAIRQVRHFLTGALLLIILFEFASFALGRFPGTRYLANHLISLVVDPLRVIGQGALEQLPNVVFLAVLTVVFRVALRVFRAVFEAVERGTLPLPGFEADWALPTYKIVRFAWIAFGVVVAYPYLPGSRSEAFKGVSIFVGVLFSLGSSSAIANVIAGYLLIYRRAFRIGDRVKIGETVGDVTDSRLQVTRLRSLKNEEVVIPNSTILNSEVTNYTALARTQGLILHTTVGIGYETPWRQVEAMLLLAAERTPGILRTPAPFVLQRALADYSVNYEINVFTDRADLLLELYHELHRSVLDVFNEYGVQIMTPSYMADPAQPKIVRSADWHLAPAAPPRIETEPA